MDGKLIRDVSTGRLRGSMKIPVGGSGNNAITPDLLRKKYLESQNIYTTNNPNIDSNNGFIQDFNGSGTLDFQGNFALVRVKSGSVLNISNLHNTLNYNRDNSKDSLIFLIKINGVKVIFGYDYKDGDLHPIPISCANATSSISLSIISGVFTAYIDDDSKPYMTGKIGVIMSQILLDYSDRITGAYDGYLHMVNIDVADHRIKLVPKGETDYIVDSIDINPSFHEDESGTLYFCLKAGGGSPTSCLDATDYASFYPIYGLWDVYLDGSLIYESRDGGSIINQLKADYPDSFTGGYDTFLEIENISEQYHRFKIVPIGSATATFDLSSNPTIRRDETDQSISFCLSPKFVQSEATFEVISSWSDIDSTGLPKTFKLLNKDDDSVIFEYDFGTDVDVGIADLSLVANAINNADIGLSALLGDGSTITIGFTNENPSPVRNFYLEVYIGNEGTLNAPSPTIANIFGGTSMEDPAVAIFKMKPV